MIPGTTSKLSESVVPLAVTIYPKSDIVKISSTAATTVLNTIIPAFSGFSGIMFIANASGGAITAVTTGNINTTCSIPDGNVALFVYSRSLGKWLVDKTT